MDVTKQTKPEENDDLGPLPDNWEMAYTEKGEVYFIEWVLFLFISSRYSIFNWVARWFVWLSGALLYFKTPLMLWLSRLPRDKRQETIPTLMIYIEAYCCVGFLW